MSASVNAAKRRVMADLAGDIAGVMMNKGLSPEEIVEILGMTATLVMTHDDMQDVAGSEAMRARVAAEGRVLLKVPVASDEVVDRSIRAFSAGLGFPIIITLSSDDQSSPSP